MGIAKVNSGKLPRKAGRYDNNNPRAWAAGLSGWQQRAHAAQHNGFEAAPLFIAAVILAQQAHAEQGRIDTLALIFIGLRLLYTAAYLMNFGVTRSLIWTAGVAVCVALFTMA